jgi:hypothetical protein
LAAEVEAVREKRQYGGRILTNRHPPSTQPTNELPSILSLDAGR